MTESSHCIITGMQVLVDQKWEHGHAIVIEAGKIKAILKKEMVKHHLPAKIVEFPKDYYLIPGLIDLHIHGADGKDVMDAHPDTLNDISHTLAEEGVTGYLATTMTADAQHIESVLKAISLAVSEKKGAAVLGAHLEGPFISHQKMGAQCDDYALMPDSKLLKHWQSVANGAIKLVTLAPELPGAVELIKTLHNMNVIASMGHTHATYDEAKNAIAAGCSQATHLFNAMRGLHQREPGTVGAVLFAHEVMAELIVDGVHLHPVMVELALRLKTKDRLLLVTDAMRAKCLGDGSYELGGQRVTVTENKATLADGTLAGSTLRMPQAIKNMMQFTRCSLEDAIAMATINPARVLKLSDRKGSIAIGKDADLVVMNSLLDVVMTMRDGQVVYQQ